MAYTQTDIDKLRAAMAQGALRVRFADREVTYRGQADMERQLSIMQAEVDAAAGISPKRKTRRILFLTSKGL